MFALTAVVTVVPGYLTVTVRRVVPVPDAAGFHDSRNCCDGVWKRISNGPAF
jgi:hypothetical protein